MRSDLVSKLIDQFEISTWLVLRTKDKFLDLSAASLAYSEYFSDCNVLCTVDLSHWLSISQSRRAKGNSSDASDRFPAILYWLWVIAERLRRRKKNLLLMYFNDFFIFSMISSFESITDGQLIIRFRTRF